MSRAITKYWLSWFFLFLLINCGSKGKPSIDPIIDSEAYKGDSLKTTTHVISVDKFYELENSIEDVKKEIETLHSIVIDYNKDLPNSDYAEQLKKLIDKPPPIHKVFLKNGSIIEGTIEKDRLHSILVQTNLGKLIISKTEIENIVDLVIPNAEMVFIGHGKEEIFKNYRLYSGKIMNKGSRRADFVRIVYNLWDNNTQLIISDSIFVNGSRYIYKSGIISDTTIEPNETSSFDIKITVPDSVIAAYTTRNVYWELYD